MSKEIISTSDGDKLWDSETKKLAGSPPGKPSVPTVNPVASSDAKRYPITEAMSADAINSAYEKFVMKREESEALAESRRADVEKALFENQEREAKIKEITWAFNKVATRNQIANYYAVMLSGDSSTEGYGQESIKNLIKRVHAEWEADNEKNIIGNDEVIFSFADRVIEALQSSDSQEYIKALPIDENELRYIVCQELNSYFVNHHENDIVLIDIEKLTQALNTLKEAKNGYQNELNQPSSRDTGITRSHPYWVKAKNVYLELGYDEDFAEDKAYRLFENLRSEAPF